MNDDEKLKELLTKYQNKLYPGSRSLINKCKNNKSITLIDICNAFEEIERIADANWFLSNKKTLLSEIDEAYKNSLNKGGRPLHPLYNEAISLLKKYRDKYPHDTKQSILTQVYHTLLDKHLREDGTAGHIPAERTMREWPPFKADRKIPKKS